MLVCVGIAFGFSFWQFDAWQERRADAARDLTNAPPRVLTTVISPNGTFPGRSLGRPVTAGGTWQGDNFYIEDRTHQGKQGYWVVTLMTVDGTSSVIPVVRGWSQQPDSATVTGPTSLTGWLQASENSGDPDVDPNDRIFPTLRIPTLAGFTANDLFGGYVIARSIQPPAQLLVPVTPDSVPPVSSFTALRNLLYALEWLVFAGFAVLIWVQWCREAMKSDDEEQQPSSDDVSVA